MNHISNIERYNSVMNQARENEKSRDWKFAEKLWLQCHFIATENNWTVKSHWCANRADFCNKMAKRSA